MTKRVAIIGAGPCGLSQLRAFAAARERGDAIPEIVCFDKQDDWGGLWNYTWRIGLDERGEPVHGSMYRYLWSNGPKECLEFADYTFDEHFGQPIPSFPPREVLTEYILGRAERGKLRDFVRLSSVVRDVRASGGGFEVVSEDLATNTRRRENFDHVIVASGHFSTPHMPRFDGIERFPGRVLHGHDFREAREFAGQDLLVVGASYSAEDIGLQCMKYGARSVTFSYRTAAMGFRWPAGMEERPLLQRLDGRRARFKDGTSREVDAIILCTGYLHHFPFLDDDLRLRTGNRLYPDNLYKGVVWLGNPGLFYLGMQDQYYTFSMFDVQAWYVRDVVLGRIPLPSEAEMRRDIADWRAQEAKLADPEMDIDFQAAYVDDLAALSDYPAFDNQAVVKAFKDWEHHKMEDIVTYRDKSHISPCTGTMAPVHHTAWIEAMDDSRADFMRA